MHPRSAPLVPALVVAALSLLSTPAGAQQKRVYLAPDDHTDYFWRADEATYEQVFLDTLDYYLDLTDATSSQPTNQQSRWNCDGSLWLWTYERHRPTAAFQRLIERIRDGHVSVPLNPLAVSLGGTPAEAVLRGMYYPGRIEREYDLRFPLAYMMEDQTQPLGLTSLWAGSGARWSWKGICDCDSLVPNPWDREHEIYMARGLDGAEVLMKWNSQLAGNQGIGSYAEAYDPYGVVGFVTTQAQNNGFAARYPYDVIGAFGHGWDNLQALTPVFVSAAQTLTNASRRVIVSNEADFFEDFEATYGTAGLPRKAVSFGNEWELYVASLAEPSARLKRSLETLRAGEALAAIESPLDPGFLAGRADARDLAFMDWGLYYEHNFGMVAAPTGSTGQAQRLAWQRRLADEIDAYVDPLLADGVAALGRRIPTSGSAPRFFVFNPLGWSRTDVADLPWSGSQPVHVVDVATGAEVPSQVVNAGGTTSLRVIAHDVPSLGYRVLEVRQGPGSAPYTPGVVVSGRTLDNGLYAVTVESDGAISSLIDHVHGDRELAKNVGGRWLNDLGTASGSLSVEDAGPLSITLRADCNLPVKHTSRVTLYAGVERIDIVDELTENFDSVQTWSFGLDLSAPRVRHEEVGAILDARLASQGGDYSDRNARYDWLTLNHFADVSGADGAGLTLSNRDCYYFRLGNSSVTTLDTATPRLQVLAGGRVANGSGNGWFYQGDDAYFLQRFALRPHAGYDATAAMRMALEHGNPLVCGRVTGSSPALPADVFSALGVSDPRALLWAFKPAEEGVQDGLIARLWNVSDGAISGRLQLAPEPVAHASETTHIETDVAGAAVDSAGLAFDLGSQQMRTWRLRVDAAPPTSYCTPKINSQGCAPTMSWTGAPSASAGSGFVLRAADVLPKTPGVLFYSLGGPASQPFQGGVLCVGSPLRRTPPTSASGSGACGGQFALDFNAYVAAGADPQLVPGVAVSCQFWARDSADAFGVSLSDAVQFTLGN